MATELAGPADLSAQPLSLVLVSPTRLFRISVSRQGEPFFRRSASNRFDDPHLIESARFGTCYFGFSLAVAICETLLHDQMPQAGFFPVQIATLNSRHVLNFSGQPLKLADLTGASLKRLGAHAGLAGSGNYAVTQKWSAAIHAHPERVDGFIYMSRQLNTEKAVVLFDRSRSKIAIASKVALTACPGFARAAVNLGIIAS